jgi:hypothetical protein
MRQKQKKKKEESRWQDLEDDLTNARKENEGLVHEKGRLAAEANVGRDYKLTIIALNDTACNIGTRTTHSRT